MRKRDFLVCVAAGCAAISLAFAAGCKTCSCEGEEESEEHAALTTINTICPIGGDEFEATGHEASLVRTYKGKNIGFCCSNCVNKFDKMADAEKDGILSLAVANQVK